MHINLEASKTKVVSKFSIRISESRRNSFDDNSRHIWSIDQDGVEIVKGPSLSVNKQVNLNKCNKSAIVTKCIFTRCLESALHRPHTLQGACAGAYIPHKDPVPRLS